MVNAENDNFLEVSDAYGLLETLERALAERRAPEPRVHRGGTLRRQAQRARLVVLKPHASARLD
jgi:hypothetical protein